eukprot:11668649-Alexandrium_andersonii.AAC.1
MWPGAGLRQACTVAQSRETTNSFTAGFSLAAASTRCESSSARAPAAKRAARPAMASATAGW